MSAQPLDIRMAHLEGAYEQVSHRLNSMEQRLGSIDQKIDSFRDYTDQRFGQMEQRMNRRFADLEQRMDKKFLWVMGLILVSMILPLVERAVPH